MGFIYKTASFICKKKLDKNNDEEFSIAIGAFNKACETFSEDRGNFFSYAKIVIRNELIDFFTLSKSSPSHKDTRDEILNVAVLCVRDVYIMKRLEENKRLPVLEVIKLTGKNRKFIEKWRRYLISLIIILSNSEFMHLKSYLNIRREEQKQ